MRTLVLWGLVSWAAACIQTRPEEGDPTPPPQQGPGDDPSDDPDPPGDCVDACVPGSSACVGNGVQACTRIDGCARLSPVQACGNGSVCEDGICKVQAATKADLYFGPGTECWIAAGDVLCTVNVCNGGAETSTATTLKFFLDAPAAAPQCTDPSQPTEMWLSLSPIAAGGCFDETYTFYQDATPGTHRVAMFLDGACESDESNEADNYAVFTPDLYVEPPANPELYFDALSDLSWNYTDGSVSVTLRVCNGGNAAAGAFYVDFWADAFPPSCGADGDDWLSVPGLAPGACSSWWTSRSVNVGTSIYEKTAQVFLDSDCAVPESSEQNLWTVTYY